MDPVATIVAALVGGAVAGSKDVVAQAVKDGYAGLKGLVLGKLGRREALQAALHDLERTPDSQGRKLTLHEELTAAGAARDPEILSMAEAFLKLLREHSPADGSVAQAKLRGSGAIAQGPGATAIGEGGVQVQGDVHGSIRTGDGWA